MSRSVRAALLLPLFFCLSASVQAGLIRYDVHFSGEVFLPGEPPVAIPLTADVGYMLFRDVGPFSGDIMPHIVDWWFQAPGFAFDPTTTRVWENSVLVVDALGNVVSDGTADPLTNPCFLAPEAADCSGAIGDFPVLLFTSDAFGQGFGGIDATFPQNGSLTRAVGFGALTYSAPLRIEAPLPGSIVLVTVALAVLSLRRRAHRLHPLQSPVYSGLPGDR